MRLRILLSSLMVCVVVAVTWAADPSLEGVHCIVAAKNPAKVEKSAAYKGAKVFFCCDNCPKAFAAAPEKFAAQANHQLVQTGQAKQTACPISGKPVNPEVKSTVTGVEVGYCCEGCLGKVTGATPAEALQLVFADKPFEKGFKVEAAKTE